MRQAYADFEQRAAGALVSELLPTVQASTVRAGSGRLPDDDVRADRRRRPRRRSTGSSTDPDDGHVQGPLRPAAAAVPAGRRRVARQRWSGTRVPAVRPSGRGVRPAAASTSAEAVGRCRRWSPPAPGRARPRRSSTRSSTTCCAPRRDGRRPAQGADPVPDERAGQRPGAAARPSCSPRTRRWRRDRRALHRRSRGRQRTKVTADGLITDRDVIRGHRAGHPADQLQDARPAAAARRRPAICGGSARRACSYLVLDEFHTYDGAQGTDVAMLLRRLGLALKSHWPETTLHSATSDRARPLGPITPVATSATLGDKGDPPAMLEFAQTVFGERFDDDAVVTESRLSLASGPTARPTAVADGGRAPTETPRRVARRRTPAARRTAEPDASGAEALAYAVLGLLYDGDQRRLPVGADAARAVPGASARDRSWRRSSRAADRARATSPLQVLLPDRSAEPAQRRGVACRRFVGAARPRRGPPAGRRAVRRRAPVGAGADPHRSGCGRHGAVPLGRRRAARSRATKPRTAAPVVPGDLLPALRPVGLGGRARPGGRQPRHGRRGHPSGHAAPGGPVPAAAATRPAEAAVPRPAASAPVEGLVLVRGAAAGESAGHGSDEDDPDLRDGWVLPVLTNVGHDADERTPARTRARRAGRRTASGSWAAPSPPCCRCRCPRCSAAPKLDAAEKKALVFTDSVQDAAHRAGFVQARSHTLTLRSVLREAVADGRADARPAGGGGDPTRRATTGPALPGPAAGLRRPGVVHAVLAGAASRGAAERRCTRVRKRLALDAALEFGLNSRTGRTLELTGSVAVEVEAGLPGTHRRRWPGPPSTAPPGRTRSSGRARRRRPGAAGCAACWTGCAHRARSSTRGSTGTAQEDGNRWSISAVAGHAQDGMPAFPRGRPAPGYPTDRRHGEVDRRRLDAGHRPQSWYARWTSRALGVSPRDGGRLARLLLERLARDGVLHRDDQPVRARPSTPSRRRRGRRPRRTRPT